MVFKCKREEKTLSVATKIYVKLDPTFKKKTKSVILGFHPVEMWRPRFPPGGNLKVQISTGWKSDGLWA